MTEKKFDLTEEYKKMLYNQQDITEESNTSEQQELVNEIKVKKENILNLKESNEEKKQLPEKNKEQGESEKEEMLKESLDSEFETLKKQYDTLQKQLKDSKSWGHKKNKAYINAKKNFTDFLQKLHDEYLIGEEDHQAALKFFDEPDDEEIIEDKKSFNSFSTLKEKIDKEFSIYKKYNKNNENLEKNYHSFFALLPLFNQKEQEKIINYMANESPEVVIDEILISGSEIYDNLLKGAETKNGIIPYVKSLNQEIEELKKLNKELEEELNTKTGKVSSRSIKSTNIQQSFNKTENNNLQDWFKSQFQKSY